MPEERRSQPVVTDTELAVWTRRFSRMIDVGTSLMRCLSVLAEEETSGGLREITRAIAARVEAGETLSEVIRAWPEVFGDEYVAFVRLGEVGGILDVAYQVLVARINTGDLVRSYEKAGPLTRADLANWFWWFAKLLEAGVPVLEAANTLADLGHPTLRAISRQLHGELAAGFSLAPMTAREEAEGMPQPALWRYPGIFTPTVRSLVGFGVWFGPLTPALKGVADLLAPEAALEAEGKLPPLSTQPADIAPLLPPEGEHPAVRQVNEVLRVIFRSQAAGGELSPKEEPRGEAVLRGKNTEVLATIPLDFYPQCVRRLKRMAGLDPFAREDYQTYIAGTIHLRVEGNEYRLHVRVTAEDRLLLSVMRETGTVQL